MDRQADLTIEQVLSDPMIAAAMRADRVDVGHFETILRTAARSLPPRDGAPVAPLGAVLAGRLRAAVCGSCAW